MSDKSISKFLSLVLRHNPDAIGIELDEHGWTDIDDLIFAANAKGNQLDRETIERIVANSDKQRFAICSQGKKVRANQGHSVNVNLDLPVADPPELLYHGTVSRFIDSIRVKGLIPGSRHDVHLSPDRETAERVGSRRGKPVILVIQATKMQVAGHEFKVSENGVWLVPAVPPEFIEFPL